MKKLNIRQVFNLAMILGFVLTLQSGCIYGVTGIKGDGNVVKQERNLDSFSAIDVGGAFKVFLTQGDKEFAIVEADENLLDVISTEVRGQTLVIKTTEDIRDSEAMNIYLTFKDLKKMDISGACDLSSENKLKLEDLELDCSGASDVDLKMEVMDLELDFSGASNIDLYGSAENVELDLSGASDLDAYDLEAEIYHADIRISSGAWFAEPLWAFRDVFTHEASVNNFKGTIAHELTHAVGYFHPENITRFSANLQALSPFDKLQFYFYVGHLYPFEVYESEFESDPDTLAYLKTQEYFAMMISGFMYDRKLGIYK